MSGISTIQIDTRGLIPLDDTFGTTFGPRDRGILIEMSGSTAGRVHCIGDQEVTIGRGTACSIYFQDTTLSRNHARIMRADGGYIFEDLGSLNGSYVNQERVTKRVLVHGDRIRFGSGIRLQFQIVSQDEEKVLVHLYEAAVRDGLTGLYNRRYLEERIVADFAHAARHGNELCVLMIDVDHFKKVNDTHGHLAGDEVLRVMAHTLAAGVRCEDLVARYGGEEFILVARDIPLDGARVMAERLRRSIETAKVEFESISIPITVSIGIAALSDMDPEGGSAGLVARADEALYKAKEGGRNRVMIIR